MNNMVQDLVIAEKYFLKSRKYSVFVNEAMKAFEEGNANLVNMMLKKLPTNEQLLQTLVDKLNKHGKTVYKTLKEISKDEPNKLKLTKGISSLLTHVIIESETNPEYLILVPKIMEKLNNLVYELGK